MGDHLELANHLGM